MSPSGTVVVNIKCEPYDVLIGRPSEWGNPYAIGRDGSRAQVIAMYRDYVTAAPHLMKMLPTLRGKRLGCSCSPLACHGDILVELIDEMYREAANHPKPCGCSDEDALICSLESTDLRHGACLCACHPPIADACERAA